MIRIDAVFSWSGGKDSAFALYKVLQEGVYNVKYLLSTFNATYQRLSMHGVREELLEAQAISIGIPLIKVYVPKAGNDAYEAIMATTLSSLVDEGISTIIYGDIFLEDLRQYREERMTQLGLQCIFPLWKLDTRAMAFSFLSEGFRTVTCCCSTAFLDESWAGRIFDETFINELPASVDPCGENGEFHSFCFDGPIFQKKIEFDLGKKVFRPMQLNVAGGGEKQNGELGFWFLDLLPVPVTPL